MWSCLWWSDRGICNWVIWRRVRFSRTRAGESSLLSGQNRGNFAESCGRPEGRSVHSYFESAPGLLQLFVPGPDGLALVVAKQQRVRALDYFAGEDKVASVLLDFRSRDRDFVAFGEGCTHVVEERLRTEIDVDIVVSAFDQQVSNLFVVALAWQLHILNSHLEFGFGGHVILRRSGLRADERDRRRDQKAESGGKPTARTDRHGSSLGRTSEIVYECKNLE